MSDSGAKAALQGFRLQALYILHTVLSSEDANLAFLPEGQEDLDIYHGEQLSHSIQVKSHKNNLRYSDFNPTSSDSFFRRSLKTIKNTDAAIKVATYGPVGPELAGAWSESKKERDSLFKKFYKDGYTQDDYDALIQNIEWEDVNEQQLESSVFKLLQNTLVGGEPSTAFDLLNYWINRASEESLLLSRQMVVEKIQTVGLYLEQRAAHHEEWFTSIKPIMEEDLEAIDQKTVQSDFYEGVSVGYRHILCDLDVIRTEKLHAIEEAFQGEKQVVIIHGASGQGKSALAYRYLHDYVPSDWRFSIGYVDDRKHAAKIALAISEHHDAFGAPVYVYIDVRPSDVEWPKLVKRLIEKNNIRVLVAIREEDLARASAPQHELGFPYFIDLFLSEPEANLVFDTLVKRGASHSYPSFNDAWARFGGQGPLLEFVFLLTQAESLQERIKNQVSSLEEDVRTNKLSSTELHLLRVCSVATAYEAQVKVKDICNSIALNAPAATLRLFEQEYLLRLSSDGQKIVCLHPIRSEILSQELCDDIFHTWADAAELALEVVAEECLEGFLLYAFSRHPAQSSIIIKKVLTSPPLSWVGILGVAKAVLWLGIKDYVSENIHLIKEAQSLFGKGWQLVLNFDLTGEIDSATKIDELFKGVNPELAEKCELLRAEQTPKERVYKHLRKWVTSCQDFPHPATVEEWQSLSEFTFWFRLLEIENEQYLNFLSELSLEWPLKRLPLKPLCELIFSMKRLPKEAWKPLVDPVWEDALEKFKKELLIINFTTDEANIKAHYIVDEDLLSQTSETILHDGTMERVELLAMLFPEYKAYGVQGYGHKFRVVSTEYDPTLKEYIDSSLLRPSWVFQVNPTFLNLVEWDLRPTTWVAYASSSLSIRTEVYFVLKGLEKGLISYFKKRRTDNLGGRLDTRRWDSAKIMSQNYPLLPRLAVDEWGKVSETKTIIPKFNGKAANQPTPLVASMIIETYRKLVGPVGDYFTACENFLSQAFNTILFNSLTARCANPAQLELILAELAKQGINNEQSHLSTVNLASARNALANYQSAFQRTVGEVSTTTELSSLEIKESKLFETLCPLWYQFVYFPEKTLSYPGTKCRIKFEKVLGKLKTMITSMLDSKGHAGYCDFIESDLLYDGDKALWVAVDVKDHMELIEEADWVRKLFGTAFSDIQFNSYEYHALAFLFEHVVIVPHVGSYTFSSNVVCIPLPALVGKADGEPFNTLLYAQELGTDVIEALGFEVATSPALDFADSINKSIGKLYLLAEHLADLSNIPEDVDEDCYQIFKHYCSQKNIKLQHIMNGFGHLIEESNIAAYCEDKKNPDITDAVSFVCDVVQSAMPESNADNEFTLDQHGLSDWAEVLAESSIKIGVAQWYILKAEVDDSYIR